MDDFMFLASDEGAFTSWSGEGLLPMGLQPDGAGALTFFTEMGEGVLREGELSRLPFDNEDL